MEQTQTSTVILLPVPDYAPDRVDAAIREGFDLLGGAESLFRPGEKILLKPNLLGKATAEKAVTTHPAVFGAVARALRGAGFTNLCYGDSPANPATTPAASAQSCGIAEEAEKLGIPLADFGTGSAVAYPEGKVSRAFYLCRGVQEAGALVSISKMKTHALMRLTGAVKNQYGCVCGLNKGTGHVSYPDADVFADMLIDLNRCVKPRLYVMDGIVAMEGNGPSSGVPKKMGVLLMSRDPVALDAVFAALVHLDPSEVPTCVQGEKRGLGVMNPGCITVRTPEGDMTPAEAAKKWGCPDFDVFRGSLKRNALGRLAMLLPFLQARPAVVKEKCVACGVCERVCPVEGGAVHSGHGQKAIYDYKKCIHCFCCQEMCPAKAIVVHRPWVTRMLEGREKRG